MKKFRIILLVCLTLFAVSVPAQQKITGKGIELIKHFEGFRANSYADAVGIWTIGWGTTTGIKPGMFVTKEEATVLLLKDVNRFEIYVDRTIDRPLMWHQFDALVSFTYNLGYRLTDGLRSYVEDGNTAGVGYKMLLYGKARINGRYVTLPGLLKRRKTEFYLYKTGILRFQ